MKLIAFILSAIAVIAGAPMGSGPTDVINIAFHAPVSLTSLSVNPSLTLYRMQATSDSITAKMQTLRTHVHIPLP